jgi:membrane protein implicated in regulation of membrane protease activity
MSWGQIAALIFAILLLLPGGCFLIVGVASVSDRYMADLAPVLIIVGVLLLSGTGLLFWVAFRRRRPAGSGTPQPPADPGP